MNQSFHQGEDSGKEMRDSESPQPAKKRKELRASSLPRQRLKQIKKDELESENKLQPDEDDELENILTKFQQNTFVTAGDTKKPTHGEKLYHLKAMNEEYLRPLIQDHKKRIFNTRILV